MSFEITITENVITPEITITEVDNTVTLQPVINNNGGGVTSVNGETGAVVLNLGQLEEITEGGNTGYALRGDDRSFKGNIGNKAIDLSTATSGSGMGASGDYSFASGFANRTSGYLSTAFGINNTASGFVSTTFGQANTASGTVSTSFGQENTSSGAVSTAIGNANTASGFVSTAIGQGNTASSTGSTAIGQSNFARASNELSAGVYGTDYTPSNDETDRLVNYGNGISTSSRSDAWTLFKNGAVKMFSASLATVTNAVKGFLMIDENGRPNAHDGSQWNALAYSTEIPTWTVVSSSVTAANDQKYSNVANATYTDPTPVEGKGYIVKVVNGTATIGGTAYTEGSIITRTYHSGSWRNKEYVDLSKIEIDPAGSDTEIQFNDSGSFGSSSNFKWDDTDTSILLGNTGKIKTYNSSSYIALESIAGKNIRITTFGSGDHLGINSGNTAVSSIYLGASFTSKNAVVMLRGGNAANNTDTTEYVRFEQKNDGLNIDLFKGFYWVNGGAFLFNTDQGNHDFRVYGQSDAFLIRADASSDRVGIGFSAPTEKLDVNGNIRASQYKLSALNTAPSSATDTGTTGEIRVTSTHIYVCTATDTWVRAALSTW